LCNRVVLLIAFTAAISACSGLGGLSNDSRAQRLWGERKAELAEVRQWDIYARAVLRLEGEAYNVGIRWQRHLDDAFMMLLEAPFGQGVFRIDAVGSKRYRLSLPDGSAYENNTVEALLQDALGWTLPASGLDFWIRGLPRPGGGGLPLLDGDGRARTIRQDGWQIDYIDYFDASDLPALPRRLRLENDALTLKLAIERWRPASAADGDADLFPSFD
jgi:outer membrane lipoprotein LolB